MVKDIYYGNILSRIIAYVVLFVLLFIISLMILQGVVQTFPDIRNIQKEYDFIISLLFVSAPGIIILYIEYKVQKFRRKNGLSVLKNIAKDVQQVETNERIVREHKAFKKLGIDNSTKDSDELEKWFNLKKEGAISEEEFAQKKKEILSK